ncbi:hypothetical protein TKK_0008033 [Trichogramma kaykai]
MAFHSKWTEKEQKFKNYILHVIAQSQHPVTIKANNLLPTLSLSFFSQYISIWPYDLTADKKEIFIHQIRWWISFINICILLIPLILGVYYFRHDNVKMTKTLSELTCLTEIFFNLIQSKLELKNFQIVFHEIGTFIKEANKNDTALLQKYLNKYRDFQLFMGLTFILVAILFSLMPIVTRQSLPADAWYPFEIKSSIVLICIYATQVLAIFQTAFGIFVDIMVAFMLWFSAARFEMLEIELQKAVSELDLKICVHQHRKLIILTNKIKTAVKLIILKTNATMLLAVICGAFQLLHHQSLEVLIQFVMLVAAGCLRLYVSAKAADDLKENNDRFSQSILYTPVIHKSKSACKLSSLLTFFSQRPVVVSIPGIIKAYTLQYYASFLSTTVTYFLHLRIILDE